MLTQSITAKRLDLEMLAARHADRMNVLEKERDEARRDADEARRAAAGLQSDLEAIRREKDTIQRELDAAKRSSVASNSPLSPKLTATLATDMTVLRTLLVQYFAASTANRQLELLNILCNMLEVSNTDRQTMGMVLDRGRWRWKEDSEESSVNGATLADNWVAFLLRETGEDGKVVGGE